MFILGIVSPKLVKQESRKEVVKTSAIGFVVCFILTGVFITMDSSEKKEQEAIEFSNQSKIKAFNDSVRVVVQEGKILLDNESWAAARSIFEEVPTEYLGHKAVDSLIAISLVGEFLDSLEGHISNSGWLEIPDMIQVFVQSNPGVNEKVPDMHVVAIKGREFLDTANLHIEGNRTLDNAREGLNIGDYEWAISRASELDNDHPLFSEAQAIVDQAKLRLDQKEAEAERLRDPEVIKAEIVKIRNKVFHIMDTVNKANDEFADMLTIASDDELYRLAESLVSRNKNAYKEINKLAPPKNMDEDLYDIFEEGIQDLALKYWNVKQGMEVILKYFTSHDQEYVEKYQKEMAQARSREEKGFARFAYVEEKLGIPVPIE